ncbi:hypothetical protein VPHD479_0247 [Vibrio phage D479]
MITIVIDTENGIALPESKIEKAVQDAVDSWNADPESEHLWTIGQDTIFAHIRLQVAKGAVDYENIRVFWTETGDYYEINDYGNLRNWPHGMFRATTDAIEKIVRIQLNKRKEARG